MTVDLGARRTFGQVLASKNIKYAPKVGTAVACLDGLKRGQNLDGGAHKTTTPYLLGIYNANQGISDVLQECMPVEAVVSAPLLAAIMYLATEHDDYPGAKKHFISAIAHGSGLTEQDPAYLLRQRLLKDKAAKTTSLTRNMKAALIIKAWNVYRVGGVIGNLRWAGSGPMSESFPTIN